MSCPRMFRCLLVCVVGLMAAPTLQAGETVVLLHGLARSADSMASLGDALQAAGFRPCNIDYPSRHHPIEVLAAEHVRPAIDRCVGTAVAPLHFVTHSLGGIIVRQLAATGFAPRLGRVVMLSPPNGGSEVVDKLGGLAPFRWINGPAGQQLGTAAASLPRQLGPAGFELGIITGNRSINWILSGLIPGDDDGKVSIDSAKLQGMQDFLIMPASHPFIMKKPAVMAQVVHFLREGAFLHEGDGGP